ncbi:MAG: hypothetical protein AAF969_03895 [Bacteroidota bacterium]
MKKIHFALIALCFVVFACSTESDVNHQQSELESNVEFVEYVFEEEKFRVSFEEDDEGEFIPLQDASYDQVQSIFEKYPDLTQYVVDDNNIVLIADDSKFEAFLSSKKVSSNQLANSSNPYYYYVAGNLILYENCCYDSRYQFEWANTNCSFPDNTGDNRQRLTDFGNRLFWDGVGLPRCGGLRYLTNPNDKLSSVKVFNVAARLYEHKNYSGKSVFIEGRARFGKPNGGGIKRLKKIRFGTFGNWDNKTSSIRLYN